MRDYTLPRFGRGASLAFAALGLLVTLLVTESTAARAQSLSLLFDQRPDYPRPFGAWNSSTPLSAFFADGFQTFDDFVPARTAFVTQVKFYGLYLDGNTPANNPVTANTFAWGYSFASDASGFPGGVIATQILAPQSLTLIPLIQTPFAGTTVRLYEHILNLPQPVLVEQGNRYWFSPISVQPDARTLWAWQTGAGGALGNGVSRQYALTLGGSTFAATRGDLAFTVIGAAAPEPASFALLSLALVARGWLRRPSRRRFSKGSDGLVSEDSAAPHRTHPNNA
jgi:hypothetical protein